MGVTVKKTKRAPSKKVSKNITLNRQVYREIITPTNKKVLITLPATVVGKTVEVIAFEMAATRQPIAKKDFWDTFGSGKVSLLSAKGIRENAWRKYEW